MSDIPSDDQLFILNDKNVLITASFINSIFAKYGIEYNVCNLKNYQLAMTHNSYCIGDIVLEHSKHNCTRTPYSDSPSAFRGTKIKPDARIVPLQKESYERLEFLGDSIIHHILASYIYNRFDDQQEGFMTKLRAKLENSDTLAKLTKIIGLNKYILLSRYYENNNCRVDNIHILEDVFEAFIGALSLDTKKSSNFEVCEKFVITLIELEVDIAELLHTETNYKDTLLKYAHTRKWPDPGYGTRNVIGTSFVENAYDKNKGCVDNKTYVMWVKIGHEIHGVGKGNSKKQGEQAAAAAALRKLGVICDNEELSDEEYEYIQ